MEFFGFALIAFVTTTIAAFAASGLRSSFSKRTDYYYVMRAFYFTVLALVLIGLICDGATGALGAGFGAFVTWIGLLQKG